MSRLLREVVAGGISPLRMEIMTKNIVRVLSEKRAYIVIKVKKARDEEYKFVIDGVHTLAYTLTVNIYNATETPLTAKFFRCAQLADKDELMQCDPTSETDEVDIAPAKLFKEFIDPDESVSATVDYFGCICAMGTKKVTYEVELVEEDGAIAMRDRTTPTRVLASP